MQFRFPQRFAVQQELLIQNCVCLPETVLTSDSPSAWNWQPTESLSFNYEAIINLKQTKGRKCRGVDSWRKLGEWHFRLEMGTSSVTDHCQEKGRKWGGVNNWRKLGEWHFRLEKGTSSATEHCHEKGCLFPWINAKLCQPLLLGLSWGELLCPFPIRTHLNIQNNEHDGTANRWQSGM